MTIDEIKAGETDNVEYKVDVPSKSEQYMRTVVAYANANGGRLVFGVENNTWEISGFTKEEVFRKMDAITNAIFDSCEPKITPSVSLQEFDGKYIIIVKIPAGMQKPYCIKSEGMLDGVYLRVSGTTRKAALYQIQEMVLSTRNRCFDQEKVDRELTDAEIETLCERLYSHAMELCEDDEARKKLKRIGKNQLLSYKLIVEEENRSFATNGYQLLDGQLDDYPDASIQCAVFKGTSRNIFITRKEFRGSIDMQVKSAYAFVLEHIDMGARFEGLARQDIYELPIRTIREIITNAVCHRSYLSPGKVQVALYDDRLEVTSPGMLDMDLTIEQMKTGLSRIRNRGIAEVFAYMHMIEGWGSGIPDMFMDAQQYGLPEPVLEDRGSDFRVNLYRRTLETDLFGVVDPKNMGANESNSGLISGTHRSDMDVDKIQKSADKTLKNTDKVPISADKEVNGADKMPIKSEIEIWGDLTPQQINICQYIEEHGSITSHQAEKLLGVKQRRAREVLKEMVNRDVLVKTGSYKSTKYWIKSE
ncbi:MAG: putative DNA binding domain-containing protein [Clostridiales bacterium]|nr:putative DNA binding domain-containing protein [Clostridiales bacterium]